MTRATSIGRSRRMWACVFVAPLLFAIGCAKNPLPTYPEMTFDAALPIIRQRTPSTFTLQGSLTLSEPGRSVTLDAAMVVRQPSELRLRAWKFGQAVFDLTVRPDGVWAYSGREEVDRAELGRMAESISTWMALLAPLPDDAAASKETSRFWIVRREFDGTEVQTEIDRKTLVATRLDRTDRINNSTRIDLSRYTLHGANAWPGEIVIGQGERKIRLRTSSLTPTVAANAFKPPARAERLSP